MNEINELDEHDIGLKKLMGKRFRDMTEEDMEEVPTDLKKIGMDFTDRLMAFGKKSAVFAVISWACFYWETAGLMDASIAVPAMWVCAAAAGFGAGRLAHEGRK